jgi:hypothetical protein
MQERTMSANLICSQCGRYTPHLFMDTKQVTDEEDGKLANQVYYRCMTCANARVWGYEIPHSNRPRLLSTGGRKASPPPISAAEAGKMEKSR